MGNMIRSTPTLTISGVGKSVLSVRADVVLDLIIEHSERKSLNIFKYVQAERQRHKHMLTSGVNLLKKRFFGGEN
jgi:hypothetical protein